MPIRKDGRKKYYFIDIDLRTLEVLGWGSDEKSAILAHAFDNPFHYRVFTSRGQFNKLEKRYHEVTYGPIN